MSDCRDMPAPDLSWREILVTDQNSIIIQKSHLRSVIRSAGTYWNPSPATDRVMRSHFSRVLKLTPVSKLAITKVISHQQVDPFTYGGLAWRLFDDIHHIISVSPLPQINLSYRLVSMKPSVFF